VYPNLEDEETRFEVLKPERIGVTLSEEFMLEPEQTTSAIIVHQP
jgi:5-methyltetrahydrofolate--homocysteine methyltransferase